MDIDLKDVVSRLTHIVDVRLPGGMLDNVPDWFVRKRTGDRARWLEVFGCEIATLTEARRDRWPGVDAYTGLVGTMLTMLLPDGRYGLATDIEGAIPPGPEERAVVDEVLADVLAGRRGAVPTGMRSLPRLLEDTLIADGLSPDGFRAIAACLNDVRFRIGGLRRSAKLGLSFAERNDAVSRGLIIDGRPVNDSILKWREVEVQLSKTPAVWASPTSVRAEVQLPPSVLNALQGRPAGEAICHPALAGMTIVRATPRRTGFTMKIREGGLR